MNVIGPRLHGIFDYVAVVFLLLAPTLFHFAGGRAAFAYVLAVVHLGMTLLTDFPLGMIDVIPFGVHGVVELIVGIALVVLPWILGDLFLGAQWFYTVFGVLIFLLWLLSGYSKMPASTKTSPKATPPTSQEPKTP